MPSPLDAVSPYTGDQILKLNILASTLSRGGEYLVNYDHYEIFHFRHNTDTAFPQLHANFGASGVILSLIHI